MDSWDFSLTEKPTVTTCSAEAPLLVAPAQMRLVLPQATQSQTTEPQQTNVSQEPELKPVLTAPPGKSKKQKQNKEVKVAGVVWHPTEEQYTLIRQLAELAWPSLKVAEALNITVQQFAGAMLRYSRVKAEYERGVENCKAFTERQLSWRPMPADIKLVRECAAKGLRDAEIAARLKVSRHAFTRRMGDTPQLREAFEQGEGEFRADLIEDSHELLDSRSDALKYVSSLLIFKLKAHCELNDKPEAKPLMLEGKIEHRHTLNAPKPVAIQDISEFAKIEMERAAKISTEKLKAAGIPEAVEAEVVNE